MNAFSQAADWHMSNADKKLFRASLKRCLESPDFIDRFYDFFVNSSPLVAEKFTNTDMTHQKQMLKNSLYVLELMAGHDPKTMNSLQSLAHSHNRSGHAITGQLYDLWLDSILKAAQSCDSSFDSATVDVWRRAMMPSINYLHSHY